MMIYFFMLIILLFCAPIYRLICKTKKQKKYWCVIIFLLLFVVMAMRDVSVGIDTRAYCDYFMRIGVQKNFFNIVNAAPIYSIYSKLIYLMFPYENAIIIANSLLVNACVCYFIYFYSPNAIHSSYIYIISYMYLESFNGTRQFLAMGFLLMSYCMRRDLHLKKSVIYLVMACGMHITAIVFIPFIFINEFKLNNRRTNIIVVIIMLTALIIKYTLWPLMNFVSHILPKYAKYLNYDNFISSGGRGNNIYVTIFYLCFLLIALFIVNKNHYTNKYIKININNQYSQYMSVVIIFSSVTIFFGLFFSKSLMMNRMREYFSIFWILLIPSIFEILNKKRYIGILYFFTYLVLLVPFIIQLLSNQGGVVPYILYTR